MLKRVEGRPEWLDAPQVRAICSVSCCTSKAFDDFTELWRHNDFWFFDSPDVIASVVAERGLDTSGLRLFYYELFEHESDPFYDGRPNVWRPVKRQNLLPLNVELPRSKRLLGYDVVTWNDTPECSPLSCNHMASELPTNADCLFDGIEAAKSAIEANQFKGCEDGLYRIVAVYEVDAP